MFNPTIGDTLFEEKTVDSCVMPAPGQLCPSPIVNAVYEAVDRLVYHGPRRQVLNEMRDQIATTQINYAIQNKHNR